MWVYGLCYVIIETTATFLLFWWATSQLVHLHHESIVWLAIKIILICLIWLAAYFQNAETYSKCEVFDLPWSSYNYSDFLSWNRTIAETTAPTVRCNKWNYALTLFTKTAQTEVWINILFVFAGYILPNDFDMAAKHISMPK